MKRFRTVLAAALMAVLLCSMLTAPAAAAYPDGEAIIHTEAVDSLTALGLFAGYEDGSFRPQSVITRAQMAKLICLAFTGGRVPLLGSAASVFSDTAGHWADGFITFCFQLGVISGDAGAGGPFRPDDTVSAAETAKMILVALGYDAALSRFTGEDWAFRVAMAANRKNLFDGLSGLSLSTGLTRDNAAQMLFRALEAPQVTYTYALVTVDGVLVSLPREEDTADTILRRNFGAARYAGVITANESATALGGASTLLDAGMTGLDTDGDRDVDLLFAAASAAEAIGRQVSFYAKNPENGVFRTVYGGPVLSPLNEAATYTAALDSAAALEAALKQQGIQSLAASVVTNRVFSGTLSSFSALDTLMGNGIEVTVVDNGGDGAADYVLFTRQSVGRVVGYSASGAGLLAVQNTSSGVLDIGGLPFAAASGAESVKKGDIVLYFAVGTRWLVEKAERAEVSPQGIGADFVIAGDVRYDGSALVSAYNAGGAASLPAAVDLSSDYVFYLDRAGCVVYTEQSGPPTRYLMFTVVGGYSPLYDTLEAKAILDDGTETILSVSALTVSGATQRVAGSGAAVEAALKAAVVVAADAAAASPKIYSYTLASDGSCRVAQLATGFSATKVSTGNPTLTGSAAPANANTRFILSYDGGFRCFTGISAVPTILTSGDSGYCFTYDKDGAVAVAFLSGAVAGVGSHDIYVLHTGSTVTLENERLVYRYAVLLDGVRTELEVTGAAGAAAFTQPGLVVDVSLTLDGTWRIDTQLVPAAAGAATLCENGVIRGPVMQAAAGSTAYAAEMLSCDGGTRVYRIDGADAAAGSLGDVVVVSEYPSISSSILIVRRSLAPDTPDYYTAGSIYIVE